MKKTIAVFMRPGSQWNPDKPVRKQAFWDDHARFMDLLFDAGEVILAGPFVDGSGSMVILAAENVEAARAVFQEDPWTLHDILVAGEAKEWTMTDATRSRGECHIHVKRGSKHTAGVSVDGGRAYEPPLNT